MISSKYVYCLSKTSTFLSRPPSLQVNKQRRSQIFKGRVFLSRVKTTGKHKEVRVKTWRSQALRFQMFVHIIQEHLASTDCASIQAI